MPRGRYAIYTPREAKRRILAQKKVYEAKKRLRYKEELRCITCGNPAITKVIKLVNHNGEIVHESAKVLSRCLTHYLKYLGKAGE